MLVGIDSNGSILVSGSTGTGGAAPLVNINYPAHKSTYVSGTMVEVRGRAVDPEGQPVTTECIVDGVRIGSSTGGDFRFLFRASKPSGHVVSVRSRDGAGIVGSDEIKVSASPPQLANDLESEEGKTYLTGVAWTSFGGRAYVAGANSLYRTRDDGAWESVLLPSLPDSITHLVAGNGSLILQTSGATFVTRDGVVWTQLDKPAGAPIAFSGGWFVTSLYDSGLSYTQTVFSRDGLSWTFGSSPGVGTWNPSAPTITPGGNLLVIPPYRSIDGGSNWIPIPEFGSAKVDTLQFATAFGAVFAGLADGRVFRSLDDGRNWQEVARFDPLPAGHEVRLALHADRLFWGGGGYWLGGSTDGTSWRMLENEPLQSSHVTRVDGRFVGFGRAGMLWSANGYVWQPAQDGPQNPLRGMLAEDGDGLLVGDSNGGVWRGTDGRTWSRVMPGIPLPPAPASDLNTNSGTLLRMGNTTVIGGSADNLHFKTYLWFSENGGLDWRSCSFHGGSFSGVTISKMWVNGGIAFAATSRILPENNVIQGLWRSTDGRDWQHLWSWPGGGVADMQFHGNEAWCLGTNGELRRSIDSGNTWSDDSRPGGLLSGRLLIRFDGAWIVVGTEGPKLQGPNVVHVSVDGQTWTKHAAPGGETTSSRLAYAATSDALVVTSSSGKIYTTINRQLSWTNTATLNQISNDVYRVVVFDGKFSIPNRLISGNGFSWTAPTRIDSSSLTPVIHFKGVYVGFPNSNSKASYWSTDGIDWIASTGGALFNYLPVFAVEPDVLRVRDIRGAIWETGDGKAWLRVSDGVADISNIGFARRILPYDGLFLATGTEGLLQFSDDDGRSWQSGMVNGRQLPIGLNEREIKTSPTEVLAIYDVDTNVDPPVCRHFRSEDGRVWSELPNMAALNVMDYAWADGTWLAICHDGSLLRSTDGGLTWSAAGSVPNLRAGRRLTRFQGVWVAAGTTTTGISPPVKLHSSPDGITWTDQGDSGSLDRVNATTPPLFFTGHGLLFFGRQPSVNSTAEGPVKCTVDGVNWVPFAKGGNASSNGVNAGNFIPLADGYLAFAYGSSTSFYWKAPAIGGSWGAVPALQNQIRWVGTPDGKRLFLFGRGIIKEWTTEDLDLTIADPESTVIGVGDEVAVATTLRNLGTAAMTDPIKVDAWLSTDRFFGDGNDIYVGWNTWAGPAPDAGNESTRELSFTLPNTVRPGSHYLILKMQLPDSYLESNRANNVAITGRTVVIIPQRKLKVTAEGNGTVSSDQTSEDYPHGARIAFVASPGKGARFAGWGGDAVGSLSETLVIMDADKNVEANFVSTAALTVFTRGGGTVRQSADDGIYLTGSTAILTAHPLPGWTFSGWSGSLTGNQNEDSLLMNSSKIVTARFAFGLDAWKTQKFSAAERVNPDVSSDEADADGDGLENWREWLRGSNPKDRGDRGQGSVRREGNWIVINYTRMENLPAGHEVHGNASFDLVSWAVPVDERVVGSADGVETIEARVDVTGMPRGFLRISESRPEP